MPLGREIGLSQSDIVLDEDPPPPRPKGCTARQFSAHICCGQMAGWIKMKHGMQVGLGHIVLDGDPAPPKRGHSPQFLAHKVHLLLKHQLPC